MAIAATSTTHLSWSNAMKPSAAQLEYWRQHLVGLPRLDLREDAPRPSRRQCSSAELLEPLGELLPARILELAEAAGTSPFVVLIAGAAGFLSRYAAQEDVILATSWSSELPSSGRHSSPLSDDRVIPLRLSVDTRLPFAELVRSAAAAAAQALSFADTPPEVFQEILGERHSAAAPCAPLIQVLVREEGALPPVTRDASTMSAPSIKARDDHDLTISVRRGEGLSTVWHYNAELFSEATVREMARSFACMFQGALADPAAPLSELPMVDEEQRQRILAWNSTEREYPRDRALNELISDQCARTPEAIAVQVGDETMTYRELDRRSSRLALEIAELDLPPESIVGIYAEPSFELIVGLLAVQKSGHSYLPLDTSYPRARLEYMVEHSRAAFVLAQPSLLEQASFSDTPVRPLTLDLIRREAGATVPPAPATGSDRRCYVRYTSGSTGKPKGVEITHRSLVNYLWHMKQTTPLDEGCSFANLSPLSFDISETELWLPLLCGARLLLIPRRTTDDGMALVDELRRHRPTHVQTTPSRWRLLLAAGLDRSVGISVAMSIGEAFPLDLAPRLQTIADEVWNDYGPTESTVASSCFKVRGTCHRSVAIGSPMSNTTFFIVDEQGQLCPPGVAGELLIGGDGLARGYLGRPELTGERFIFSTQIDGTSRRLYRTGDLAVWRADGIVEYIARLDHQIKLRGYRIELGEIETLLRSHAAVRDCVVVVRQTAVGDQLVAYLCLRASAESLAAIRTYLEAHLPVYMVPTAYVLLDALPITPSGKVDRKALPEPGTCTRQPEPIASSPGAPSPHDSLEGSVKAIWREVLGIADLGDHDSFFDLGGHSLPELIMLTRVKSALGVAIPHKDFIGSPTVAALAALVAARGGKPTGSAVSGAASPAAAGARASALVDAGSAPATGPELPRPQPEHHEPSSWDVCSEDLRALRKRMGPAWSDIEGVYRVAPVQLFSTPWVFQSASARARMRRRGEGDLDSAQLVANMTCHQYAVRGKLELAALDRAWKHVIAAHEATRTTLYWEDLERPLQIVWREADARLEIRDLRDQPPARQEEALLTLREEAATSAFPKGAMSWVGLYVVLLSDVESSWTIAAHHAIADKWGIIRLVRELIASYRAILNGQGPRSCATQYSEYLKWLSRTDFEEAARYVERYAKTVIPKPSLPLLVRVASGALDETARQVRWTVARALTRHDGSRRTARVGVRSRRPAAGTPVWQQDGVTLSEGVGAWTTDRLLAQGREHAKELGAPFVRLDELGFYQLDVPALEFGKTQAAARRYRVSLSEYLIGCWAFALGGLFKLEVPSVIVIDHGRPTEISGVDTIIGNLAHAVSFAVKRGQCFGEEMFGTLRKDLADHLDRTRGLGMTHDDVKPIRVMNRLGLTGATTIVDLAPHDMSWAVDDVLPDGMSITQSGPETPGSSYLFWGTNYASHLISLDSMQVLFCSRLGTDKTGTLMRYFVQAATRPETIPNQKGRS